MGEFARQVKNGTIHGPHTRKFKREDWEAMARREDTDFDDKRLARAGIFFDDLLTFLRSEIRLSHLPFQPSAIMRLAVGLPTWNYCRISAEMQGKLPTPKPGETHVLMQSSLEGLQISVATGQLFAPDELIDGLGNELKYLLDDLRSLPTNQTLRTEYDASRKDIDDISLESNKAMMYSCTMEYWLDCVGLGYGLTHHQEGVAHVSFDPDQEIALRVSSYRRLHLQLQDKWDIFNQWIYQLPDAAKTRVLPFE